jgi:hypothetical protein
LAFALVLLSTSLASCSSDHPAQHPKSLGAEYAVEIRELAERSNDQFVRRIARDGTITADEYQQLQGIYIDCMHREGFPEVEVLNDPITQFPIYQGPVDEGSKEVNVKFAECAKEVGLPEVEALYTSILANPYNEDMDELLPRCLRAVGAVDDAFTLDDAERGSAALFDVAMNAPDPEMAENCLASPHQTLKYLGLE